MNELMDFEGNKVEVFDFNGEILFNPYHVGKCLDLTDVTVRRHIQDMNEDQVIKLTASNVDIIDFRKLHNTGENFLKEAGVYTLCNKSRCASYKKNNLLRNLGLKTIDKIGVCDGTKETNFLYELEESLKPFNIKGIRQYHVLSYRIDYYIPSLNIVIEYDENNHKNYTYEQHKGRQKEIERELNCRFIRVSDDNSNSYNIGLVIKEIFDL